MTSVLSALRSATSERHGELDRSMPLSRPDPTLADYLVHLHLMRAWLYPLECWLEGAHRMQTALIDADLADAGIRPDEDAPPIGMTQGPASAVASYRWGARYVIEGSRLGAAVLYGRLRHGLRPNKLRYLQGDPGASANRWKSFLRDLGASVESPDDISIACRGACDAFDALLALTRQPHRGLSFAGEMR